MVAMRQTLQEMKWPQPKSPLQTDNSAAAGVVNNPIVPRKINKFVMFSASEAELGALFITAQEMVVTRQTLQEMKWPQPKSLLQTDNSAAAGVVNNTIVPRKLKKMDPCLQ